MKSWQGIRTAPKDGTQILSWWPIVKLNDDGSLSAEKTGEGGYALTQWVGYWTEPEQMESIGESFGDDEAYAAKPTHWQPLPAPPKDTTP